MSSRSLYFNMSSRGGLGVSSWLLWRGCRVCRGWRSWLGISISSFRSISSISSIIIGSIIQILIGLGLFLLIALLPLPARLLLGYFR